MIDPKFDKLPEKPGIGANDRSATALEDNETTHAAGAPRRGLSVNDTVAAEANLSTGGRGADVSGVRAGSGAGAGSSFVTPGSGGQSPAPNVMPGPRGSGTTPISDSAIENARSTKEPSDAFALSSEKQHLSYDDIASHAYRCWHERGCPEGSPEVDWQRAEADLRNRASVSRAASAKA